MDIKQNIALKMQVQQHLVERINALAQERQQLIEEVLRTEGEIRLLKQLEAEECQEPTRK